MIDGFIVILYIQKAKSDKFMIKEDFNMIAGIVY